MSPTCHLYKSDLASILIAICSGLASCSASGCDDESLTLSCSMPHKHTLPVIETVRNGQVGLGDLGSDNALGISLSYLRTDLVDLGTSVQPDPHYFHVLKLENQGVFEASYFGESPDWPIAVCSDGANITSDIKQLLYTLSPNSSQELLFHTHSQAVSCGLYVKCDGAWLLVKGPEIAFQP